MIPSSMVSDTVYAEVGQLKVKNEGMSHPSVVTGHTVSKFPSCFSQNS